MGVQQGREVLNAAHSQQRTGGGSIEQVGAWALSSSLPPFSQELGLSGSRVQSGLKLHFKLVPRQGLRAIPSTHACRREAFWSFCSSSFLHESHCGLVIRGTCLSSFISCLSPSTSFHFFQFHFLAYFFFFLK